MLNLIRRYLPAQVKRQLKRLLGLPQTRLHPDWKILAVVGPKQERHIVLDVGGHGGWFFHCWLDWCPDATIHAFEPYPPSFEAMRRTYGADPRVHLLQVAVGDAVGTQSLNVLEESRVSNSLLAPHQPAWDELRYRTGNLSQVDVEVITLDSYTAKEGLDDIYLLKVDVQGYEMHVLRGGEGMLSRCKHIFIESGIRPLYRDAPRFSQVFDYLTARGFHLMAMQAWHRGNHVLMEGDMLFRRDDLMPPVDEKVERAVERIG